MPKTRRSRSLALPRRAAHRIAAAALAGALALAPPAAVSQQPDATTFAQASQLAFRRALAGQSREGVDAATQSRLKGPLGKLVAVAPAVAPQSSAQEWEMAVIANDALALQLFPGGQMIASSGLVTKSGFADAEIAAVVAQYVAHALLGHTGGTIDVPAAAASSDPNRRVLALAGAIGKVAAQPRYAPADIADADRLSVELMARAGYDPRAAGSAWRRVARERTGIVEVQPVTPDRLAALDQVIREATPQFEQARAEQQRKVQEAREKARAREARLRAQRNAPAATPKGASSASRPAEKPEGDDALPFDPDAPAEPSGAPR